MLANWFDDGQEFALVVDDVRPTGAHSGAETRRRILAVALELFSANGYAGTSIRDITDRMGLTKAALYYHFTSKEEILEAVTEPLRNDVAALGELAGQQPSPSPAQILGELVELLSRRIALIRTVMADPSAHAKRPKAPEVQVQLERIARAIAADDSSEALVRARCALGAAQGGAFATASARVAVGPLDEARTEAMLAGAEHLLTPAERAEILAAALRALEAG